jgi:hypothetical protein
MCTSTQKYRRIDFKGVLFVYIKPNAEPYEIIQVMFYAIRSCGFRFSHDGVPERCAAMLCTLLCGVLLNGGAS